MLSASDTVLVDRAFGLPIGSTASLTASQVAFFTGQASRGDVGASNSLSSPLSGADNDATGEFEAAVKRIKARTGKAEVNLQEALNEMRNPQ
jgi:hypothetical protein